MIAFVKVEEFKEFGVSEIQRNVSQEYFNSEDFISPHHDMGGVKLEDGLCVVHACVAVEVRI